MVIGWFDVERKEQTNQVPKTNDQEPVTRPARGAKVVLLVQPEQTRSSVPKAATSVKRLEVRFKIHMQPVNFPRSSFLRSLTNQFAPDSLMLMVRVDGGIEQKTVNAPVPGNFNEADKLLW